MGQPAKCIGGEFLMADYLVTDNELTSVADAIRAKGGTTEKLAFPTEFISAVESIPSGGGEALINGRKFECGMFTFPTAVTAAYTIQHTLGKEPSAVFLWVVDPDYSVTGQVGKFRADHTTALKSVAILAVNKGISASSGENNVRFRTVWDSTTITFNCDSIYPLLPNMEYQWLAIA